MQWNNHLELKGKHAFLSPSKGAAFNDTPEELYTRYSNSWATTIGTLLHEFAEQQIGIFHEKMTDDMRYSVKRHLVLNGVPMNIVNVDLYFDNLANYVNDAIGYAMRTEQPLYYSDDCFGTADAICFRRNKLRIHDLKTGTSPTDINQLVRYAGLFCLEYKYKPEDISIELRIYKGGEILVYEPTLEEMTFTIEQIKTQAELLRNFKTGEQL